MLTIALLYSLRSRQLAEPGAPQERAERCVRSHAAQRRPSSLTLLLVDMHRLSVHGHGSRCVSSSRTARSSSKELTACRTGESGLGKSTLINTLFNTTLYGKKQIPQPHEERPKTVSIEGISAGESSPRRASIVPPLC